MNLDTPKIEQDRAMLTKNTVDSATDVVFIVSPRNAALDALPYGALLRRRIKNAAHALDGETPYSTVLPNESGTRVTVASFSEKQSPFEQLALARQIIAAHQNPVPRSIRVGITGLSGSLAESAAEALLAATAAARFAMPTFQSKKKKTERLPTVQIHGVNVAHGFRHTLASSRGNNLARWLTALPANELTPGRYRQRITALARTQGWKAEFLDTKKLARLGAGAFLAVAQGSPENDAGILRLRYVPRRTSSKPKLALVGKGICFDTGGTNLKTARYMHGMHEDMQGSAVALGTLLALTELRVDFPVDCWLALAQNHIGPKAYKQNDVVRAVNGNTIEVVHTDAEGRMVLADTLALACREKPALVMDFATLTGACIGALSTRLSGVMTNRESLIPLLTAAGRDSGERVWPFPLYDDFGKSLKSEIADVKQCTLDNEADQILGALFLKRFLDNDPAWVHVDLASGNHKGGLAHVPTDVTGFGVRFALNFVLEKNVWRNLA